MYPALTFSDFVLSIYFPANEEFHPAKSGYLTRHWTDLHEFNVIAVTHAYYVKQNMHVRQNKFVILFICFSRSRYTLMSYILKSYIVALI